MNNTIAIRVHDFLKNYPPFNMVEKARLLGVAEKVVVQYYKPGELIFEQGADPNEYFYMVKEGAVQIKRKEDESEILVDKCDEGDVFGIRPLLAKQPYVVSAVTIEETLIYAIHTDDFEDIFTRNSRVAFYLASNFAAGVRNQFASGNKGRFFHGQKAEVASEYELVEVQSIDNSKKPIVCSPDTLIKDAAQIMTDKRVGSIIVVNDNCQPLGRTTDKDFRKKIATGLISPEQPITDIMSSPVITALPERTVADVQIV
ncbi:MAG TPA: cyclic nucleotide-binding domain-containing protein, partial [Saprospiraceae bacterium]|nr:cyclic nucleotide-binding domain-containing protein [Saprospiraceae bacterium]